MAHHKHIGIWWKFLVGLSLCISLLSFSSFARQVQHKQLHQTHSEAKVPGISYVKRSISYKKAIYLITENSQQQTNSYLLFQLEPVHSAKAKLLLNTHVKRFRNIKPALFIYQNICLYSIDLHIVPNSFFA